VTAPNDAADDEIGQNCKEKKVVTASNEAADDEIGQNCKEKKGSKGASPWTGFGAVAPINQSFLKRGLGQRPTSRASIRDGIVFSWFFPEEWRKACSCTCIVHGLVSASH
ncbi:MAG: hypothetical protein WC966_09435, partial [Bradymonadales bacterium]